MRIKLSSIILMIIATTPIFDAFNGFATMYSMGPLEQIVPNIRILFILLFIIGLSKVSKEATVFCISMLVLFIISIIISSLIVASPVSDVVINFTLATKLIYFFTLLLYLFFGLKSIDKKQLLLGVRTYALSMPLLIIVPTVLGIGRVTYASSEFGNSGWFIANNASNFALITSMFIILIIFSLFHKAKDVLALMIQMIALLMQGTKTGIVVGLIILIMFCLHFVKEYLQPPFRSQVIVLFSILIIILLEISIFSSLWISKIIDVAKNYIQPLLDRQQFLSKQLGSGTTTVLFSGRLDFAKGIFEYLGANINIFTWLFGVGSAYIINNVGHISEMDGIDIFVDFGITGILITYGVVIFILIKLWRYKNLYAKIAAIFALSYSFLAGHVFVDIISSTGLILIILLNKNFFVSELRISSRMAGK